MSRWELLAELDGHVRGEGRIERYHLVDVGFDISGGDVAVFFKQLAGVGC